MSKRLISLALLMCLILPLAQPCAAADYLLERSIYKTKLLKLTPAPQEYKTESLPDGVTLVEYTSGQLQLKGWLAQPKTQRKKTLGIVYLHAGYAFDIDDFRLAQPMLDAGYTVFFPFLRAENGNPGQFEMLYGEVEDALAAVDWLSQHLKSGKEPAKIGLFGHGIGGSTAELTTLWPNKNIAFSASISGLQPQAAMMQWRAMFPFDGNNQKEIGLRNFVGNLSAMKRPHLAMLGERDPQLRYLQELQTRAKQLRAPLTITVAEGEHDASVAHAVRSFLSGLEKIN